MYFNFSSDGLDKKGNKENMMVSTYEGQDEDASVVIPNASITPGKPFFLHHLLYLLLPTKA